MDEAQFLTKTQVHQLCRIVDELNRPVLAYGLRSDFLGEPFEGSRYLLTWADVLTEIKTICHCGRKASFNARMDEQGRKVEDGEQIVIGGNDRYVSVCRRHFHSGLLQPDHLKSGTSLADSAIDLAEVFEKSWSSVCKLQSEFLHLIKYVMLILTNGRELKRLKMKTQNWFGIIQTVTLAKKDE